MPRDHAHWESSETALLLKLAIEEKQKSNWNHFGVTKEGWRNIYPYFSQYIHKQVTKKFDALKQKYKEWHDTQSASDLGQDTTTWGIVAEPEYWQTQYGLPNDPDDCT